ncbi:MAG: 3-methyl-2-oxobutanoate hydroxymethyltransferase [bacterium]|nr:3-methyl-2-oxobutanoate hydroxymethyltransferase [bacterium]
MSDKITTAVIRSKKGREKIVALTAYDAPMAVLLDEAGIDMLLVGDSVGNVILGYEDTVPVTTEEMLHHVKAVSRGVKRSLIVADMPFLSYGVDKTSSLLNAGRFLKEGGASAVKLEGGTGVAPLVAQMVEIGIPVMGHIGLQPQSINQLGSYRARGREREEAAALLESARALDAAGIFALLLECVPRQLAARITEAVGVPTIGIGAGEFCDGQILVTHDILGLGKAGTPRFVRRYLDMNPLISSAVGEFVSDVRNGGFPSPREGYDMPESELEGLR